MAKRIEPVLLTGRFLSPVLHHVVKKFGYPQNKVLPSRSGLGIFRRQVDRVVNKTRRRSSLLTSHDGRRLLLGKHDVIRENLKYAQHNAK